MFEFEFEADNTDMHAVISLSGYVHASKHDYTAKIVNEYTVNHCRGAVQGNDKKIKPHLSACHTVKTPSKAIDW